VFDDTPLKPYNVTPDPLLSNFKTVRFRLLPNGSQVQLLADPPLPELQLENRLALDSRPCGEWKNGLQVEVPEPNRVVFSGRYRAACGERDYYLGLLSHADYSAALIAYLWRDMGGELSGRVREAMLSADATLWFEHASAPLVEVIRDINKFSNNTQARLLYIALGGNPLLAGTDPLPAAESALRDWLQSAGWPHPAWCWKMVPACRARSGRVPQPWQMCWIWHKAARWRRSLKAVCRLWRWMAP
jgi:D-alanyl-D-alanine carboxypeptidase/D-alanyl-D-alanine-endopeptidase (penicillin-binding protein 4)